MTLGRCMVLANADQYQLFVGLKYIDPSSQQGHYYWVLCWKDEDACKPEFWTQNASGEEQLKWAKEKVKDLHPDLRGIVDLQKPEKMLKPFLIRDLEPVPNPPGPVTLIGDASHALTFCKFLYSTTFIRQVSYRHVCSQRGRCQ